jgi:hypothetical protein
VTAMRWQGFLIIPALLAIIIFAIGYNGLVSDPLDYLAIGLGVLIGIAQIIIWILWVRRTM